MEPWDVVIVGGGPAGLSAAVNVVARGGRCAVLSNAARQSPLWRAERIDNYSGLAGISGAALLKKMKQEARQAGVFFVEGRVTGILFFDGCYSVTVGTEVFVGKRLVLAIGAGGGAASAREQAVLGRGLSYCATCDGRLYRGRTVLVTGDAADLTEEAAFLQKVGCSVTVVTRRPLSGDVPEGVACRRAKSVSLWLEGDKLRGLEADGEPLAADGVFWLRQVSAPQTLLPGLRMENGFIAVDRQQQTNLPGCYAAGDCTGRPLQIAKAVGEGLVAAQAAMGSLKQTTKTETGKDAESYDKAFQ